MTKRDYIRQRVVELMVELGEEVPGFQFMVPFTFLDEKGRVVDCVSSLDGYHLSALAAFAVRQATTCADRNYEAFKTVDRDMREVEQ